MRLENFPRNPLNFDRVLVIPPHGDFMYARGNTSSKRYELELFVLHDDAGWRRFGVIPFDRHKSQNGWHFT